MTLCAARNCEDKLHVGHMQRIHCSHVITDELKMLTSNFYRALLHLQVLTEEW